MMVGGIRSGGGQANLPNKDADFLYAEWKWRVLDDEVVFK
jgi:hypothetical protein